MALADRYSTLEFDLDSFPLVLVHFPQRFEAETLQQLKAMQERLYGFKQRYLSIVDLRDTGLVPNASIRREASDWTKAQEPLLKRVLPKSPQTVTVLINETGHYVMREQPETFVRALRGFCLD